MSEFQKRIDNKMRINELEKAVKNLALCTLSQKRELLEGFVDWFNINDKTQAILSERIEEYLKTL
jgi:L-lactate utilization protein LutB